MENAFIILIVILLFYQYFSEENVECRRLEKPFGKKRKPWKMPKFPTAMETGRALGRLVRRFKCI